MLKDHTNFDLVISYERETLSARVLRLDNLEYNRYSVFFNQQLTDDGLSHILISKRIFGNEYIWVCEERSWIQDDELAVIVGEEIDRYYSNTRNQHH